MSWSRKDERDERLACMGVAGPSKLPKTMKSYDVSRASTDARSKETYRYLSEPAASSTSNPFRVIAHCDVDAAYAQFEAVRTGSPDDVPLIVIQWDTIIAVNYPARKYGIKRCSTMGAAEARALCPHIVIVHTATFRPGETESGYWEDANVYTHKVSLDPYRKESAKIMGIFRELLPECAVEKASIDEAYMDLTPEVLKRLLARFPHLSKVPHDAPRGVDSFLPHAPNVEWSTRDHLLPADDQSQCNDSGSNDKPDSDAEEDVHEGDDAAANSRHLAALRQRREAAITTCWSDWALYIGAEIMQDVRQEIWSRLHYTTSAGVAHNKAMAKLCSSQKKPMGQTVLRNCAVPRFLSNIDFTEIRNLGGKLGRAISEEYDAVTVGQLLSVSLETLQAKFGEEVIWVYNLIRGIDESAVSSRTLPKSMIASKNVIPPVVQIQEGFPIIRLCAGELALRLREAREISPHLWPKTLCLSWRLGFGYGVRNVRSRQCGFPHPSTQSQSTSIGEEPFEHAAFETLIEKLASDMWSQAAKELWDATGRRIAVDKATPQVTTLALSFTGINRMENGQKGIKAFLTTSKQQRRGTKTVSHTRAGISEAGTDQRPDQDGPRRAGSAIGDARVSWVCPRCGREITTRQTDSTSASDCFERSRQEHDDHHVAADLQAEMTIQAPSELNKHKRKRKPPQDAKSDIRAFLKRKG